MCNGVIVRKMECFPFIFGMGGGLLSTAFVGKFCLPCLRGDSAWRNLASFPRCAVEGKRLGSEC